MKISKTNKLFLSYRYCLQGMSRVTGNYCYGQHLDRTNLCQFVRVIVIWYPAVWVLQLLTWAAVISALFAYPLYLFGQTGTIHMLESIVVLIVTVVVGLALGDIMYSYKHKRAKPLGKPKDPTFLSIAKEVIISKKQKICPWIEFE